MISYKEPILFVHGPPIFIRVVVKDEESTSVFVLNGEEAIEKEEDQTHTVLNVNSSILRRITYLNGEFQKEVYQPLQFVVGDEIFKGIIDRVEGETVFIHLDGKDEEVIATELSSIEEILWRGQPFTEK